MLAFDFIEPPAADQLADALQQLYVLGAIDARGAVTTVGAQISRLPLDPAVGRIVVAAARKYAPLTRTAPPR